MINKKIIIYIIVIIVILTAVFLSQQAYSRFIGKNLISAATNQASAYLAKDTNLVMPTIYSKIGENVQSGGEAIKNILDQGQQKISDVQKNIENYFSGVKDAVAGKSNNSCPTPTSETSAK